LKPEPGAPTPPIEISGGAAAATDRLPGRVVEIGDDLMARLRATGADVSTEDAARGEAGRDWWPLAMVWATEGQVGARPAAVARPTSTEQVAALLSICDAAGIPVTTGGGRSSVVGGAVPVHGGLVLDTCGMSGIVSVDATSMVVEVLPGTFGDAFEAELQANHGLTVGHWPQSMTLSTVGGWLACRGAGQLSNRYGKIEDIVVGLEVVLADGRAIRTGGQPRQAVGPDLDQLFVGSEGTLGVITRAWLQAHPAPTHRRQLACGFATFAEGLDAMRRITQRGATPAVMRLYDEVESKRNHETPDGVNVLLVLDEGDGTLVDAGMEIVEEECEVSVPLEHHLVDHWMEKRNDVAALEALISRGYVVDTMEVAGPWSVLPDAFDTVIAAVQAVPGTLACSAHQSHSYQTGACLYFTFAGAVEPDERDAYYVAAWDAGTRAALAVGCALSHHHGVGINRARFVAESLGPAVDVLASVKAALDPNGILNPGKLGLADPFGPVDWPAR
jgi:alkyldihydroxyacetonephosphate synthase